MKHNKILINHAATFCFVIAIILSLLQGNVSYTSSRRQISLSVKAHQAEVITSLVGLLLHMMGASSSQAKTKEDEDE